MLLALLVLALVATALALSLVARTLEPRSKRRVRTRRRARHRSDLAFGLGYDPGRERRAEQRARELLRSCVNHEEWAMYRDLGFIKVAGKLRRRTFGADGDARPRRDGALPRRDGIAPRRPPEGRENRSRQRLQGDPPYAYLVYPHKPIVAYVPRSGRLLSEYCVEFPDLSTAIGGARLPASDDVLAKWMALTSDEERVIRTANMHLVGRQLDPGRVRRDLWRLAEWERRRSGSVGAETS